MSLGGKRRGEGGDGRGGKVIQERKEGKEKKGRSRGREGWMEEKEVILHSHLQALSVSNMLMRRRGRGVVKGFGGKK